MVTKDKSPKGLLRNKVYRIGDVILCNNEAKNADIALAKVSIFNAVSVQKNKAKCKGYFVTDPKQKKTLILLSNLFLALLILGCTQTQNDCLATISISEQAGLSRDLEYVSAIISFEDELKASRVLFVTDMETGTSMPVQVLDTVKKEGKTRMIVMFPVGIEANQTKKFQCGFVEKMRDRPPPSNLFLSDDGHSVENSIYRASFSTENDKRGGQVNGIALKEFDGQVLKRDHIAMHWAPNFSKSGSDGYFNMEDLPKSSENTIERGLYQIVKKRSGTTDSVPEINLEGKYTFYEGLRYFEFSSTMTVTKDVELDLLRNDEMTMDSLFTHLMYTLANGKVSHLKLYDEELDQLEEDPITDDASWLAFYNVDKGYGYGCIRLKYDNTNNSGNSSTTYKPYTKISKSKNNGRYWNRMLIRRDDILIKKGDRYTENNAYLIFQVDRSAPEKAMQYYADRLMNPLSVKVETP